MAKKENTEVIEPTIAINAIIRKVQQKENDRRTDKSKLRFVYLKKITSLLKVILWPLVTLIIVALFWTPLKQILEILPSTLSQTSKLSIGDFSLEVRQHAITEGFPELANKLGGLSINAINVLLLTNDVGYDALVSYNEDQSEFYLPNQDFLGGLIELEQKELIAFNTNSEDWLNVFRSLDLRPISVTWLDDYRTAYATTRPLSVAEKKSFTSNWYKLTDSGIAARTLIIQTIYQLLSNSSNN